MLDFLLRCGSMSAFNRKFEHVKNCSIANLNGVTSFHDLVTTKSASKSIFAIDVLDNFFTRLLVESHVVAYSKFIKLISREKRTNYNVLGHSRHFRAYNHTQRNVNGKQLSPREVMNKGSTHVFRTVTINTHTQ